MSNFRWKLRRSFYPNFRLPIIKPSKTDTKKSRNISLCVIIKASASLNSAFSLKIQLFTERPRKKAG